MGFDFTGYVLRAPRTAPTNASSSAETVNGVVRHVQQIPDNYDFEANDRAPQLVDVAGTMYRTSFLDAPGTTPVEYILWAENTSNLALRDDSTWSVSTGQGTLPVGNLTVENLVGTPASYSDGTSKVVVADNGGRSIGTIFAVVIARGDVTYDDGGWVDEDNLLSGRRGSNPYEVFFPGVSDQDPVAGTATLSATTSPSLTALGGGLSASREDSIVEVHYTIAPSRFWWTRNDRYQVRFGWNDTTQKWEPYKGNASQNIGVLKEGETYKISPRPRGLVPGTYLPGNGANSDEYSMIRLGASPDALSTSLGEGGTFEGILVQVDSIAESYDFSLTPTVAGVIGQTNGTIIFNPALIEAHAGKTVWYNNRDFAPESAGIIGSLRNADISPLFISPIPGPADYPLISLGTRSYLSATVVDDEAILAITSVSEGEVAVARSTGRLKLSSADIKKANPNDSSFSKFFLGESVLYDGLSLSGRPQTTKKEGAIQAVTATLITKYFLPEAVGLPEEWVAVDPYRGLGVSGTVYTPDQTGVIPSNNAILATVRPGGDGIADVADGRIRQVEDGIGDTIVFSKKTAMSVEVVDREDDIPARRHIPQGTCYICRESVTHDGSLQGCRVVWGRGDSSNIRSDDLYFLQATLTPSTYTEQARLLSKTRYVFRFPEVVNLYLYLNGTYYTWSSTSFNDTTAYTPEEVADDIAASLLPDGTARAINGSVSIESVNLNTGSVEVGWGPDPNTVDTEGAALLGFLPGWRVVGGVSNWVPDSGVSFGMYRSPLNMNRQRGGADYKHTDRIKDLTIYDSIPATPSVFLDAPPLQDVAGFDEGVFFNLKTVMDGPEGAFIVDKHLEHYVDVVHDFGARRFLWAEDGTDISKVEKTTDMLSFNQSGVFPDSLLGAPGIGGGLYISEDGGPFVFQDAENDYILPQDGVPGTAQLVVRYGERVLYGGRGSLSIGSNLFTDPDANFYEASEEQATDANGNPLFDVDGDPVYLPLVREGYRLKITSGDAAGSYEITGISSATELSISPASLVDTPTATPWEIYKGYSEEVYDPAVVADQVYQTFQHLPDETMKVRRFAFLGVMPTSVTEQAANRLTANLERAVSRGREISIRYGLTELPATGKLASLVALAQIELGTLANNTLTIPTTPAERFNNGNFELVVGTVAFSATKVATFSADPGGGTGIEYLEADTFVDGESVPKGRLKFGSAILLDYAQAQVWYFETFQDPSNLAALVVEYNRNTGVLNFSSADMASQIGEHVYFVERMITEDNLDVSIAPLAGGIGFTEPMLEQMAVEVTYAQADAEGRRVGEYLTEFLPVFKRDDVATRIDDRNFDFNVTGRYLDFRMEPIVYVGSMLQNYGGAVDYVYQAPESVTGQGRITFVNKAIPSYVDVKVTYLTFNTNGGETAYSTSLSPVYRPPFFIKAGLDNFGLRTDRTSDFQIGQLLRLGENCHYIRELAYFSDNDITRVDIFPPTVDEEGTRSPGNDVLTVLTAKPITTMVDPDGVSPVPTSAYAGFMQEIPITAFPFEPVSKGHKIIIFRGDLTAFAVPGHILEIAGQPFTIASVEKTEDGTRTKITTTAPFMSALGMGDSPTVKLSYRPVYPPEPRDFVGIGPVLDTESHELVLYGKTNETGDTLPGRTLVLGVEYSLDPDTGEVSLVAPVQAALGGAEKLLLSHTRRRTLSPFLTHGIVGYPRIYSQFLFNTTPSEENGLLGGQLTATYTFRSPDTFYCRAVTVSDFLGEAIQEAIAEIKAKEPAGGALKTASAGSENWDKGRLGLKAERRNLLDKDRAARTFLDFYNTSVLAFEQIPETIAGGVIGDRDGKFKFFIGKGLDFPTPGYEDDITGELTTYNLWSSVFYKEASLLVGTGDPIIDPAETVSLVGGVLTGTYPSTDRLEDLIRQQLSFSLNHIDDQVLVGIADHSVRLSNSFPWFAKVATGDYAVMGEPHPYSRLFPTRTNVFGITYPGINATDTDPGFYSFGRSVSLLERKSTFRKEIGQLSNPVLGNLGNVTDLDLSKRWARGRIWGYYPEGIPENTFAPGVPAATDACVARPCIVVFPVNLSDVPLNPDTGYPDVTQLLSQTGDVYDAETGNSELATPGFQEGDQLYWGKPTGEIYEGANGNVLTPFGGISTEGLYVHSVEQGCIILFTDAAGSDPPFGDAGRVRYRTGMASSTPVSVLPIEQGDTLFVLGDTGSDPGVLDPPTTEELATLAASSDIYRVGFDVGFTATGKLFDVSLPSFQDNTFFALKEWSSQNPPAPLSTFQGVTSFGRVYQNPVNIPALKGEMTDDVGDYQIPYLGTTNTELDRFTQISLTLPGVLSDFFPDEIRAADGEIVGVANIGDAFGNQGTLKEGAVLMTHEDMEPDTTTPALVGLADLRAYDVLLVETDDGVAPPVRTGSQGILNVGAVTSPPDTGVGDKGGFIKPPRFVTMTTPPPRWQVTPPAANATNTTGSRIWYSFENAYTFLNDPPYTGNTPQVDNPSGLRFIEADLVGADGIRDTTLLDFSDTSLALTDGTAGNGNLNSFFSGNIADTQSYNRIAIKVYARTDSATSNGPESGLAHGQILMTFVFERSGGGVRCYALPPSGTRYITGPDAVTGFDFVGGGDQLVRWDGGSWLDEGYTINHTITVENSSTGNAGTYTITGPVTANILTVPLGSWPVGGAGDTTATIRRNPVALGGASVVFGPGGGLQYILINHPGIIDWGIGTGAANAWQVPYTVSGSDFSSLYGYEFSISYISGWDADADWELQTGAYTTSGWSDTGWIANDRLTFNEVYDMRLARIRGTTHSQSGVGIESRLRVKHIAFLDNAAAVQQIDVNDVNGGAFTFLQQSSATGTLVGATWTALVAGTSPEQGTIEVPPFEGSGNTPILGENIHFAGVATSDVEDDGAGGSQPILTGTGFPGQQTDPVLGPLTHSMLTQPVVGTGAVDRVQKGDICIIEKASSATEWATPIAGPYIVRYALPTLGGSADLYEASPVEVAGVTNQILGKFPTVTAFDSTVDTLNVTDYDDVEFGAPGTVFVIMNAGALAETDIDDYRLALWSATYAATVIINGQLQFQGLANYAWAAHDGTGAANSQDMSPAEILEQESFAVGKEVSGFDTISLDFSSAVGLDDESSLLGYNPTGAPNTVCGVRAMTLVANNAGGADQEFTSDGGTILAVPGAGQLGVETDAAAPRDEFAANPDVVVYTGSSAAVARRFNVSQITATQWNQINNGVHAPGSLTNCLVPTTTINWTTPGNPPFATAVADGFQATAGIFFEPTWPIPVVQYGSLVADHQHVVDADHTPSLDATGYGFREDALWTPHPRVNFSIRRGRRWHEAQDTASNNFPPLRYIYEIRRGRVTAYSTTNKGFGLLTANNFTMDWETGHPHPANPRVPDVWNTGNLYSGTNLGIFIDLAVGIHAGDEVRLLDDYGNIEDKATIVEVVSGTEIKLAVPGFGSVTPTVGQRFEVFLRQAPVPHEQSAEMLLDLVSQRNVLRTDADWVAQEGGYVLENTGVSPQDYDGSANKLYDDLNVTGATPADTFGALGVRRGDILLLDPAGTIPEAGNEQGTRPLGDEGVEVRQASNPAAYAVGGASNLDDNRGFYRVTNVVDTATPPYLEVSGVHTFAGSVAAPVVFPDDPAKAANTGYAIYPTIHASKFTPSPVDDQEAQNDLRPTKTRSPSGSYTSGYADTNEAAHSIRPFSYRIIRPNSMFSDEAIDMVLMNRERLLSWINELSGIIGAETGDYWVFQRDTHASDVGDPVDFTDGLGVLGNGYAESLMGRWNISPFSNTSDCLSVLDRRFWIHDSLLDRMEPTNVNPAVADPYQGQAIPGGGPWAAFPNQGGPYTAYTTDLGSAVLPVLPERVTETLDSSDRFRPIRYVWVAYRTHRILGTLAAIQRYDAELPLRLEEQRQAMLTVESTEKG